MLLWMAWVWHASGRVELARSAFALAGQLSDEQYAVPSHPFTVALFDSQPPGRAGRSS